MNAVKYTKHTQEEQQRWNEERDAAFESKHGRPMTYEDVILSFGGSFGGQSIVEPRTANGRTVLKGGGQ